jgi:ADP-ribosyl-[dinitrogen reductase] hydrolase
MDLEELLRDEKFLRSLGCIVGAFVGDAAGAVLEFVGEEITESHVDAALEFKGNKKQTLKAGQITDDSEMALCLLHGIIQSHENGYSELNQKYIAKYYLDWYWTNPRDMGFATASAILLIEEMFEKNTSLEEFNEKLYKANNDSKSNGGLMRATPLSVYCRNKDDDDIYKLTKIDVCLTHTHPCVVQTVTCYSIAIAHLINNKGDSKGAIKRVDNYILKSIEADEMGQCEDLIENWNSIFDAVDESDLIKANDT